MRSEVVVELDGASQAVLRSGRAISGLGMERAVDWGGDEVEHVRLGRDGVVVRLAMTAGGLRHLAKIARPAVEDLLNTAPQAVFAMALRDALKPVPSRDLIAEVDQMFPSADASAAWKRSRSSFENRLDVEVKGDGHKRRYAWRGTTDEVIDALAGVSSESSDSEAESQWDESSSPSASLAGPDADRTTDDGVQTATALQGENRTAAVDGTAAKQPPHVEAVSKTAPHATSEQDDLALVTAGLQSIATGGAPPDLGRLRAAAERLGPALALACAALAEGRHDAVRARVLAASLAEPVETGRLLAELPNGVLIALADRLIDNERIVLALVNRHHKRFEGIDPITMVGPEPAVTLLLTALSTGPAPDGYELVCRRFLSHTSSRSLTPAQLLAVTAPFTSGSDPDVASWLGELVLASLENASDPLVIFGPHERQDVARRLASVPLTRTNSRGRLLAWMWAHDKSEVRQARWWRGAGFEALADVAAGPLGAALEDATLTSTLVRPTVHEALASAATRRRLLAILGAPRPLLQAVDSADVGDAIRRVLGSDELARPWLADIGQAKRLDVLERETSDLRAAAQHAEKQLQSVRGEASAAKERVLGLEARIAEAGEAAGQARESQTRQAQLDVLRSLASLASYVIGSLAEGRDAQRIAQRVQGLVARDGLVPIGSVGETTLYRPGEHELLGADQSVESPVIVTAVGYKVMEPNGEESVLVKAIVTPV